MATYDGELHYGRETPDMECRSALSGFPLGRSWLIDDWGESGSGSYPSGYPSGEAGIGTPVICLPPGGSAQMFAALEPLQSVSAMVFAAANGKVALKILNKSGEAIASAYSADSDEWEQVSVSLPSGWAKGIYLVEIINGSYQTDGDSRAYVGPLEVV